MNGHGGKRPGAGRKPTALGTLQGEIKAKLAANQARLLAECPAADVSVIVKTACEQAKAGDYHAREWLGNYLFGPAPKEVIVKGDEDMPVKFVIDLARMDGNGG